MQRIALVTFPGGEKQIREETGQLYALLRGKLTKDEAKRLLTRTKLSKDQRDINRWLSKKRKSKC